MFDEIDQNYIWLRERERAELYSKLMFCALKAAFFSNFCIMRIKILVLKKCVILNSWAKISDIFHR